MSFFGPDLHCPFFHKPLFLSMGKGKIHNLGADLVMFNATSLGFASRPLQWEELGNIHLFKTTSHEIMLIFAIHIQDYRVFTYFLLYYVCLSFLPKVDS